MHFARTNVYGTLIWVPNQAATKLCDSCGAGNNRFQNHGHGHDHGRGYDHGHGQAGLLGLVCRERASPDRGPQAQAQSTCLKRQ